MAGAYKTGKYRNIFKEYGYPEEEIQKRVEDTFNTIFYGNDDERFYHEAGDDMGYMEDTGNHDVRTEGMSYGMMVCVQLDKKAEFDRLWKWVRTYMYIEDGPAKNYFAWSCQTNGKRNAEGPAPDGEEYFAMALFFASKRWGDGDGIFCYSKEAQNILRECVHKGEPGHSGEPMWEPSNKLIKFVTNMDFSDPSYHLLHFYELFAQRAYEETGLTIEKPRICGTKDWLRDDGSRYLVVFYKTNQFSGELKSSHEGEVKWMPLEEMKKGKLANGMDDMLRVFLEEDINEFHYRREDGVWKYELK